MLSERNQIIESKNIRDCLKFIRFNTWVILDLDNTVMEHYQELGNEQWFTTLIKIISQIVPVKEAAALAIAIYNAVEMHLRAKPVEPIIVKIIKHLQAIGVPVLALTSRGAILKDATARQLKEIAIDFAKNNFNIENFSHQSDHAQFSYESGIIYCRGTNKGNCLIEFLKASQDQPAKLLMIDDKQHHLQNVSAAIKNLPISFTGLRYGFLDEKVKQLNLQLAHDELAEIKHKLSPEIQNILHELQITTNITTLSTKYTKSFFHTEQHVTNHTLTSQTKKNDGKEKIDSLHLKACGLIHLSTQAFFSKHLHFNQDCENEIACSTHKKI